jgi:hypothetical protein
VTIYFGTVDSKVKLRLASSTENTQDKSRTGVIQAATLTKERREDFFPLSLTE